MHYPLESGLALLSTVSAITVVLLVQQVFGGWQEHLHKFRHLSDDMDSAQRCLERKNTPVSTRCNYNNTCFGNI